MPIDDSHSNPGRPGAVGEAPPPVPGTPDPLALPYTGGPVQITIPTAINMVLLVAENIMTNMRVREASSLALPSLYKRAYLIAHETDELATVTPGNG